MSAKRTHLAGDPGMFVEIEEDEHGALLVVGDEDDFRVLELTPEVAVQVAEGLVRWAVAGLRKARQDSGTGSTHRQDLNLRTPEGPTCDGPPCTCGALKQ